MIIMQPGWVPMEHLKFMYRAKITAEVMATCICMAMTGEKQAGKYWAGISQVQT